MLIIKIAEDELDYFNDIKNNYPQNVIVKTQHGFDMNSSVQIVVDISDILDVVLPSIMAAIEMVLLYRINKKQAKLEQEKLKLEQAKAERTEFEIRLSSNGESEVIVKTSDISSLQENPENLSAFLKTVKRKLNQKMKLNDRIKNSILDTTIVRCEVENDDSTQHYYDSIIQSLKIDNFPLISVNTIEKKTYIVECEGLFFLVFDHYLIECMHLLNQCILNENQLKSVELFFFKSASEECYVQCNLSSAVKFASKYMNRLDDVVSIYLTEEFSKSIPNYLFIQQAFLIAHEVFHFYVHKNPNKQIKGMIAKESFCKEYMITPKRKMRMLLFICLM